MPNWCLNTVEFEGSTQQIETVRKAAESGKLFHSLYPMPQALEDTVNGSESAKPDWQKKTSGQLKMAHGADNWYDWNIQNWGTKWDTSQVYIDSVNTDDPDYSTITLSFDTAWSPPIRFYEELFEQMNVDCEDMGDPTFHIRATYYEPGCDFTGVWEDGDDRCYGLHGEDDDFFENDDDGQLIDGHYGILDQRAEDRAEEMEEVQEWYEDGKKELNLA